MSIARCFRSAIFFAVLWFASVQSIYGQRLPQLASMRIISSKQTATVRSLFEHDRKFICLKDLADMLSLQYYENMVILKAEMKLENAILKFTADNAFVVQADPETKRYKVYQLSYHIIIEQGLFFSPADETVQLLKTLKDSLLKIEEDSTLGTKITPLIPTVTGFGVEEKKNGYLLRIHLTAPVKDFNRSLQVGEWLYVTLPGAVGDTVMLDTTFPSGILRGIKPIQSETALQLSLQIRGRVESSEIVSDATSSDVLLTLIPPQAAAKPPVNSDAARKKEETERIKRQTSETIEKQKKKWKLDVIVLDAGHGGHDPGTIGVIGTREKDITLGVSLKLGELIEKYMPEVKVVYTRKTDRFVELYRRGQIANEAGGKLFISIHCNSTERKPSSANGFEIYLLRPGKTEDAIRVAEKENAVVQLEKDYEDRYQNLTEENFIILTMAQSAYVKQSEHLAELLEETMSAEMEAQRQPVKQAGFYVLVGASMPNVLIETGYLSNYKEEKFLRSPSGQRKIAEAILKALQRFKKEYEQDID